MNNLLDFLFLSPLLLVDNVTLNINIHEIIHYYSYI